jgi:hypothetical protein
VNVTGNIQSITTHDIAPTLARFVRLNVLTPQGAPTPNANIYELQVFAGATTSSQASGSSPE